MKPQDVVMRARTALGHNVIYQLGAGGMNPLTTFPWNTAHACDCSGFAMWSLNQSRLVGPVWYGTEQIIADANDPKQQMFTQVHSVDALPGDLIVFGKNATHNHGHVGVITNVGPAGVVSVCHCSLGNYQKYDDAIKETGPEIFQINDPIIARCNLIEQPV